MAVRTLALSLAVGLAMMAAIPTAGQDFRVDTEVFVLDDKGNPSETPVAETLSIFANGIVYDFQLSEPKEITIFDPQRGRFNILDESRQLKASVGTQDLLDYVLSLDSHASESKDPLFAFSARPKFEQSVEKSQANRQSQTRITLTADPLQYDAIGLPPQLPESVAAYRNFADWFARLNAARPGNLPPGPRLALNQALAENGLLPREITRTIAISGTLGRKKQLVVTSRHLVNWKLSGEDRKRIDRAGTGLATFQNVSFDEYRSNVAAPAAPKQAQR